MKTARFATIVQAAGKPDVHLLLTEPSLDPVLQKAIKGHRVLTLHQTVTGNKPDFGTVGFVEGVTGQILLFPKSIAAFEGSNVVGIKYELLKSGPPARGRRSGRNKPAPARTGRARASTKILHFPQPVTPLVAESAEAAVAELKVKVKEALDALADGKQVRAYQLLQGILKT